MSRLLCQLLVGSVGLVLVATAILPSQAEDAAGKTGSQPAYLLRYGFRVNQRVYYRVQSSTVIKMTKGSAKSEARNESTTEKHFEVTAVDDKGNAILEPMIDAVKMSAQFDGGRKRTYDSKSKDPPHRNFVGVAKTIGKRLVRLKVAPNGRLIQAFPLLKQPVQAAVTKRAGPKVAANDPSKNFLVVFPEKPIRVGESWTDANLKVQLLVDTSLRLWQPFVILRRYRLTSVKNGLATLELSMATKKRVKDPQQQVQLVQRLLSGTIVFDVKRGLIVSRKMTGDNKVFGAFGQQSLLHVRTVRTEQLIDKARLAGAKRSGAK